MNVSTRWNSMESSATLKLAAQVNAMRQAGVDVVSFAAGEPHFEPPAFLYDALRDTMTLAYTKYAPVSGFPEVRQAVAKWVTKTYQRQISSDWIAITLGAKAALHLVFQALVDPGDEVVYQNPYWVSYPPLVHISGGISRWVQTGVAGGFRMQPGDLEAVITPKTKVVVLCSPHNPTGIAYTQSELNALGEVLAKHPDIWIVSDDVYDQSVWSSAKGAHIIHCPHVDPNRVIQVHSLSKSHGVTGWRLGFLCAPPAVVQLAVRIMGHTVSHVPANLQHVMGVAFASDFSFLHAWTMYYEKNMRHAIPILQNDMQAKVVVPDGAFYIFPQVDHLYGPLSRLWHTTIASDVMLCEVLLEKIKVGLVPGSTFGAPGYVRLTTAMSASQFMGGLQRLADVCQKVAISV